MFLLQQFQLARHVVIQAYEEDVAGPQLRVHVKARLQGLGADVQQQACQTGNKQSQGQETTLGMACVRVIQAGATNMSHSWT